MNVKMDKEIFIDEIEINELIRKNENVSSDQVDNIISKARELKGLSLSEVAALLQCSDDESAELMFKTAKWVKEQIYGNRLVLFAPLYLTNICDNNCLYCAFRRDNKDLVRKR